MKATEYALLTGITATGGTAGVTALMAEHGGLINEALRGIEQVSALLSSI